MVASAGGQRGGVDFKKGCFVGQQIFARMKHVTELRKGPVRVRGAVTPGARITNAGTMHTLSGDRAWPPFGST